MSSSSSEQHSDREDTVPIRTKNSRRQTNLYVKNFDNEMSERKLCELFATYGTITSCKVSE
jgi:RNA recognition motif-containing protein